MGILFPRSKRIISEILCCELTGRAIAFVTGDRIRFHGKIIDLRKAKVPAEFHSYREGAHGAGLGRHEASKSWPGLLEDWLRRAGLLKK